MQPFAHPVCTADGTIFDITNVLPWLKKHGTDPVTGVPLKSSDLVKLHYTKNDEGEMVDPVTFKVFTDNTHIVALRISGNVFAYDTVERLNIKAKMWRDLVTDQEFSRKDIITLQDPQNVESRNLSTFKYLQDGVSVLTEEQRRDRNDPSRNVNKVALGNAAEVLKSKEGAPQNPEQRVGKYMNQKQASPMIQPLSKPTVNPPRTPPAHTSKAIPYNAAQHTTGKAAASFTSTGLTPHTSGERALLTDEEYMLKPRRVKQKGYARIQTSLGDLNIELAPEFAPRAVWNFVHLAKKGYYRDIVFHRSIRNFMLQGGDPTGTGKGGASVWGKNFVDEFDGPLTHDARGVVSMANKGKNTNSSQFFITYRPAQHLDRKHTIFGKVVGGMDTLTKIENVEVSEGENRPLTDLVINDIVVFVDPFEEFQKSKREKDEVEREKEKAIKSGGCEDDRTTWTGKRVRVDGMEDGDGAGERKPGVGKYLNGAKGSGGGGQTMVEEWEGEEPVKKKVKAGGGFGNFDSW